MTVDAPLTTDKQTALDLLQTMPDSVTLPEIIEELSILAAIEEGIAASEAGRTIPHEEVVRRLARWTSK